MKEIKFAIDVPQGKKVKNITKHRDGSILIEFEDDIHVGSKSWEEYIESHPNVINKSDNPTHNDNVVSCLRTQECLTLSDEDAKEFIALRKLTLLYEDWVGGWKPKYDGPDFYALNFYNRELIVNSVAYTQSLLIFPTDTMASEFLKCHRELIEKAKRFI